MQSPDLLVPSTASVCASVWQHLVRAEITPDTLTVLVHAWETMCTRVCVGVMETKMVSWLTNFHSGSSIWQTFQDACAFCSHIFVPLFILFFAIFAPFFPSHLGLPISPSPLPSLLLTPPPHAHSLGGIYLFEPHSPLCPDLQQGVSFFLFLSVTFKSFFYPFATQWLRWKRERSEEGGGIIFSYLSEMMTWLLSLDHASSPPLLFPR